jgi:hypothetical protein
VSNDELLEHIKAVGLTVELIAANGAGKFIVVRGFPIRGGSLDGEVRDLAWPWVPSIPYVAPTAIHVRPHAVPMGSRNSQASPLGPEWQYLSRILRVPPTPVTVVAHFATVLAEL